MKVSKPAHRSQSRHETVFTAPRDDEPMDTLKSSANRSPWNCETACSIVRADDRILRVARSKENPVVNVSPTNQQHEAALERARKTYHEMRGIEAIWRQDCHALPNEKEPFGFRDGISHPAIEGSGIPGTNPKEQPLKPGEFVLGYP